MLDRRGRVVDVVVGDATRIYLPDIGRQRGGGNLRGLRHVHTTLGGAELKPEDITDVTKLRLDLVGIIGVGSDGRRSTSTWRIFRPTSDERIVART